MRGHYRRWLGVLAGLVLLGGLAYYCLPVGLWVDKYHYRVLAINPFGKTQWAPWCGEQVTSGLPVVGLDARFSLTTQSNGSTSIARMVQPYTAHYTAWVDGTTMVVSRYKTDLADPHHRPYNAEIITLTRESLIPDLNQYYPNCDSRYKGY